LTDHQCFVTVLFVPLRDSPRLLSDTLPEHGASDLFISVSEIQKQPSSTGQNPKIFKSGLQIERGYAQGPEPYPGCLLKPDRDWHRLIKQCAPGTKLDDELRRLLKREGFVVEVGDFEANAVFNAKNFKSARQIRDAAEEYPKKKEWAGFQLYYPMPEREVHDCSGYELVQAICGIFSEVSPAMNACMQVPLTISPEAGASRQPTLWLENSVPVKFLGSSICDVAATGVCPHVF
jgi:hypothetical protein